jgi:hypothetical protein
VGRVPINDPILARFRAALDELYGERIDRVVLFGSSVEEATKAVAISKQFVTHFTGLITVDPSPRSDPAASPSK